MKRFGKSAVLALVTVVALSESLTADNNKEPEILKKLTMPKSVAEDASQDSKLVIFDPKTKRTESFFVRGDTSIATVPSPESILLEVESRDEESLMPSVWNSWELSETVELLAKKFDFRSYFRGALRVSDLPKEVKFMSFFKVEDDGLADWVVVHQPVTSGVLEDDVFALGIWICVPSQAVNDPRIVAEARIVRVLNAANNYRYDQLPLAPHMFHEQLAKALKAQPYGPGKGSEDDPFFSRPFSKNDPFERTGSDNGKGSEK